MDKMAALNNLKAALFDCSLLSDSLGASRRNDLEKNKQQQKKNSFMFTMPDIMKISIVSSSFKFSLLLRPAVATKCVYLLLH